MRIAHTCAGSFDDTLRDDLVYWIIPVADMESQQSLFISRRQPFNIVLIERQILYQSVNSHAVTWSYISCALAVDI